MGAEQIIPIVMSAITEFGFPLVVAVWALWRLDKNWAKGDNIQNRLDDIEESIDRVEMVMNKKADIQQEMLQTIKILHTVITMNNKDHGGGDK